MINFESYKGGSIEEGQTVKAYINLRNGKVAIRNKSGKVQGYCDSITLDNAHFYVSEKSLERVRKAHSKEVMAYCIGVYTNKDKSELDRAVSFNPFSELDTFYFVGSQEPISKEETFSHVTLKNKKAYV